MPQVPGAHGGPSQKPKPPPPKPSGGSSKPLGAYAPHAERGWTRFNGTLATTLPSALRQARILRSAAWRVR